ncbi:hypothetical protein D4T97_018490 [Siminovitchia acidinfaciens]|uniref:Uncharacterized protein n=1 Tax=Siminovitchia acidinfaciens TaxID=2321395 RepID=A0A429XU17_9BACI|nr:hypothetical protein [Siminovitchia acidinfaciens]RST71485.1 hypothetical protein D4T97_018490 [Siminovitchia acidinfaciens]
MDNNKLMKEAGRYKKWFEAYSLNPFGYIINGRSYHYAVYHGKKPSDFKGYAIISLDNGPKSEYREAIFPLTLFSAASANIFNIAGPRSKALPEYFKDVIDTVEEHFSSDKAMLDGNRLFKEVMDLQIRFNRLYHEYEDYYDNKILVKRIITEKDIEYTLNILSELDLLQFRQGLLLEEMDEVFPDFFSNLSKEKAALSNQSQEFIRGMQSNKGILKKRLDAFDYERDIMQLPEEEQIERKKESTRKNAEKLIQDRERRLRGPAAK